MDKSTLVSTMKELMQDCDCGSGKKAYLCCRQGDAKVIKTESCPCGSGKRVKDCCMKNPEAHEAL